MNKKDIRAISLIVGSFVAYWAFCIVMIAQNFAKS